MSLSDKLPKGSLSQEDSKWASNPAILLCPQIPKPMHGVAPRLVLGNTWWDRTRKEAFARSGFCCQACDIPKDQAKYVQYLEGHEVYIIDYIQGRMHYAGTVGLCHSCHNFIHAGRLAHLYDQGKVTLEKVDDILSHGKKILASAGLTKPLPYAGPTAAWEQWRLVINIGGTPILIPPKFKSYEEWELHFSKEDE